MKMEYNIKPPIFLIEKNNFLSKKRITSISNFTNLSTIPSPNLECNQENSIISNSESSIEPLVKSLNISNIKNQSLKNVKWSKCEDDLLIKCVNKFGVGKWNKMEQCFNGRTRKQIRQRYISTIKLKLNHEKKDNNISLNSSTSSDRDSKKSTNNKENNNIFKWTDEYDKILLKEYFLNKKSWVKISKKIPGSSENSVKNRFYSLLRQIANKAKKVYKYNSSIDSSPSNNEKDINNLIVIKNEEIYDNMKLLNHEEKKKLYFCDKYNNLDLLTNKSKKKNYSVEILLEFLPELLQNKGINIIEINKELNQRKNNAAVQIFVIIEKHFNCYKYDNNTIISTDMVFENLKNAQTEKLGKVIKNMKLKIMSKYFHRFRYNTLGI